jgi:hypothetical protein
MWRDELLYHTVEEQSRQSSFAALLCSVDCTRLRTELVVCSSHVLWRSGGFAPMRRVLPLPFHREQCGGLTGGLLPLDGRRQLLFSCRVLPWPGMGRQTDTHPVRNFLTSITTDTHTCITSCNWREI